MRVSVLTPIYKTDPEMLRAAIRSVLGQKFRDFEFLLLDDCPEDPREGVVREFDDPRIVYLKNDANLGITPSRNRLIGLAKGEYLAVFDHDDVCVPDRLAKEVAYLDAHPECGVVSGWTKEIVESSNRRIVESKVAKYPETDAEIKSGMLGWCTLVHSGSMIRKSVLAAAGLGYEERYSPCEDYALFVKLMAHTSFYNLQEPMIEYRLHANNATKTQSPKMIVADSLVRRWAERNLPDLYDEYLLRSRQIRRVRVLGLLIVEIVSDFRLTKVNLFGFIPFITIRTKRRL